MKNNKPSIVASSLFEQKKAAEKLIKESVTNNEFYLLLICSSILASIGLIINNVVVVIGGMLLAPLLSPLLAVGLGIIVSNVDLIIRRTITFFKAVVGVIITSAIIGFVLGMGEINITYLMRDNFIEFFFISIVAGLMGTYIWVKSDLQSIVSGVLIAVTILPPLAAMGIGFSILNMEVVSNSLLFFVINMLGIMLGSIAMFGFFGFGISSEKVGKTVEKKLEQYESKNNGKK